MPTSNEEYRDGALRHQIGLRRYSAGVARRINDLLAAADAELSILLRTRLTRFEGMDIDFTGDRWTQLLDDIRAARAELMSSYRDNLRPELSTLAVQEAAQELALLSAAIPIEVSFASVSADQLRAIATSRPFQGRFLKDWFQTLERADQIRLTQAIQLGMVEGEPVDNIVRRIVGTKANMFTDGILSVTRREAQAIARTAINHISNTAREYVWEENAEVITARIWHSTLDGRTSAICRARDGRAAPVGDSELPPGLKPLTPRDARPPAHMNCRSVMVAYIDGVGLIGNRPFVTDTRTPEAREIDFRAIARETGKDIRDVKKDWAARNIGRVPAQTTYEEFLRRQAPEFQDAVLGKTKGLLFRKGELTVSEFVDRSGNELTLSELAASRPEAFKLAGLDPNTWAE